MVGQTISHYKVLRKLGGGGMGVVYAAEDLRLHRQVALKFLSPRLAHAPLAMARFEREALAASAFNHPHICTIHDIDRHGDTPFIVMELIDGVSLREYLTNGTPPLPILLRLAIQITDALETTHAAGIVHRDLTPSNVFVTRRGDAKVLDFGIVKLLSEQASEREGDMATVPADTPITGKGHVVGTPGYASPEQTLGLDVDARTDIFSLGVILYQMATGCRPFDAVTPGLVNDAVVHAQPVPPVQFNPQLPPEIGSVIEKALEKDRGLRYQSAADLKADLRRLKRNLEASGRVPTTRAATSPGYGPSRDTAAGWPITPPPFTPPPAAPPPTPATRTGSEWAGDWMSRHPKLVALLATTVVAIAVVLGIREWQRGDPRPESLSRTVTSGVGSDLEPAVSPDGTRIVYVVEEGAQRSLWMVDTNGVSGVPWKRSTARLRNPVWSPDGHRVLFESDSDGRSSIHQAESINGEASTELLADAAEPAVSPDGKLLAFVRHDRRSNETRIAVASLADTHAVRFLSGDHQGLWDHGSPAWSPDGRQICYMAWDGLWVVPIDGGRARRLTRSDATDTEPVWSSSGYIYFSSKRDGLWQLWRVPAAGGRPARVTVGLSVERAPSLSSDGALLAYSTFTNNYGIAIQDLATGTLTRLTDDESDSGWPELADNGRALYFSMNAGGRQSIWRQALAAGRAAAPPRPLLPSPTPGVAFSRALQPTCSPDGRWLAFMRLQPPALQEDEDWPTRLRRGLGLRPRGEGGRPAPVRSIWVVSSSGGTPVRITNADTEEYLPRWSPDGAHVAFLRREADQRTYLWVQPVSGGKPSGRPRRLIAEPISDTAVAWSPDGLHVAFATSDEDVGVAAVRDASPPRLIAKGTGAKGFRWVAPERLLVSGRQGESIVIRAIDPETGAAVPGFAPIDLGSHLVSSAFDISPDGRFLASTRALGKSGRIGVLALTDGRF